MKSKLKLIIGIYVLFNVIVACCHKRDYYSWEITNFDLHDYEIRKQCGKYAYFEFTAISESKLLSSLLSSLGPNKAHALSCIDEEYDLINAFTGLSIKSDHDFNIEQLAGSELKDYFGFVDPFAYGDEKGKLVSFMEALYNYQNKTQYDDRVVLEAYLLELPTEQMNHIFTFTFFVEDGEDIVIKSSLMRFFDTID